MRQKVVKGIETEFFVVNNVLIFRDWVYVHSDDNLKHKILMEVYNSFYTTYYRSVKMY